LRLPRSCSTPRPFCSTSTASAGRTSPSRRRTRP